jgi:hydrogenase expression/formation protein HypC
MCLSVPGKIISLYKNEEGISLAKVDFGGVSREVCAEMISGIKEGDYVLVHVGYIISKIDEKEAIETIRDIEKISEMDQEV